MHNLTSTRAKWGNFEIQSPTNDGFIRLAQRDGKTFELGSTIRYTGDVGLDHLGLGSSEVEQLRIVEPSDLPGTDLASVPQLFRWWVNTYGPHTPAALIHDKFIGSSHRPEGVSEQNIDRYFRFMLKDLGVRFGKRWLMWTAVAFRTRLLSGGRRTVSVVTWLALALAGLALFAGSIAIGSWPGILIAAAAPIPAALLWGRQSGAGIIAAYLAMPWIIVPAVFASIFLIGYTMVEWVLSQILDGALVPQQPILHTRSTSSRARN